MDSEGDESVHESPRTNQKLIYSGHEKSSSTTNSTNSSFWIIMAPLALRSGILGGLFVEWIYVPIVQSDTAEWPDEGVFIAMLFSTVTLSLFGYLWRVMKDEARHS